MQRVTPLHHSPDHLEYTPTVVTTMGNVIEVTAMEKMPIGGCCIKLDADSYMDVRTGEVRMYNHGDSRADSIRSIKRTLTVIRAVINSNVTIPANVRWVTLTYAENMTDPKRLYHDWDKFWKRFLYWNTKNGHGRPKYISVIEPQGRGAWHVHAFFIWDHKAPYIDNNAVMAKLWGHGFTSTQAVKDVDNIGAYFSAYLADIPLDKVADLPEVDREALLHDAPIEEKTFTDDAGAQHTKKFVKGARLHFYPVGMNILRTSRDVVDPIVEKMTFADAMKKVDSLKPTFSKSYAVLDDDGNTVNTITKVYYNIKRPQNQA